MNDDSTMGWRLYLDFDGVLNNDGFLRHERNHRQPDEWRLFDPANVAALDRLCVGLPVAEIVVSSTWKDGRSVEDLVDLLAVGGAQCARLVVDVTEAIGSSAKDRAYEIAAHASRSRLAWLALDDMILSPWLAGENFHRVSGARGLTTRDVDVLLLRLGR